MEPEKKSNGAFIGLVIIIIVLIVGGIYVWEENKKALEEAGSQSEVITEADAEELNSLESDLETTDAETGVDIDMVY